MPPVHPPQVLFLNGPPGSGKDRAARIMLKAYGNIRHVKFAQHLKDMCATLYGLTPAEVKEFDHDQESKNLPRIALRGLSYREALIWLSEDVIKKRFDNKYFGDILLKRMSEVQYNVTVISDSGFKDEADPLIRRYGGVNCHVFQLQRPGHNYAGDSRGYWDDPRCSLTVIENKFDLSMFRVQLLTKFDKLVKYERPEGYE